MTDGESVWTLASPCPDDSRSDSWKTHSGRSWQRLYLFPALIRPYLEIIWQNLHGKLNLECELIMYNYFFSIQSIIKTFRLWVNCIFYVENYTD